MNSQLMGALAAVLLVGAGCRRPDDALAGDASTTAAELPPRTAAHAPTLGAPATPDGRPVTPSPRATPAPRPATATTAATPTAATTAATPIAEPPLPSWVPDSGRLTIIQAPDLARNLGLVDASTAVPGAPSAPPPGLAP